MTREEAIHSAVRTGCTAADIHLVCLYPECACKNTPRIVRAAIAEYLYRRAKIDQRDVEIAK